ncbi:FecCD family ABC transporter permease [Lachnotalea glycerini]|uniref:Iron ABC transporter permease n=1 Tax=Lachnotalea glycerini TaxID=1763509 RepID=A0A371JFV0_9FIRM|nr:iron ABC transporter permease [Lachnotalea glycerini]RDY31631.1 iron ABC transporter permease [Lachnotalea glycerini]
MIVKRDITKRNKKRKIKFSLYMLLGICFLAISFFCSISYGAADMNLKVSWGAIFRFNETIMEHQIIRTLRFPRTVADIIVGSSLAVAGAIMQGTTRNPLADSGLMGISSGATFAMAICLAFFPGRTYGETMLYTCLGAALATFMTYFFASVGKKSMSPQKLVLAGLSISMLFSALTSYIAIKYNIGQDLTYWTAGGTASAKWRELAMTAPVYLLSVAIAVTFSPSITVLSLGEEVATGLGIKTNLVKGISTVVVFLLTGVSVVIVGPIGFVGLLVPHIMRFFVGVDYRYIIPSCALYGAVFLVGADIFGRFINKPFETPLGIIFAVIGVPFFLYIARKQRREFE